MGVMKVFSGSETMAMALQARIEEAGVSTIIKNNTQSARAAGFGTLGTAVEVFIDESDFGRAHKAIEDFRMSI
jgi:hypothetical protein